MSDALAPFCGVWWLEPERCEYGAQPVPQAGVYTILRHGEGLRFFVRFRDADGAPMQVDFQARFDALLPVDPEQPELGLRTAIEDGALTTEILSGEDSLHLVRRRLVTPDSLQVTQTMATPEGPVETVAYFRRTTVKQVMVYRRDLKMRKGKIAAQCAHASMAVFFRRDEGPEDRLEVPLDGPMTVWAKGRFAKVVLSVETEDDLLEVARLAEARGLPCAVITDSGKTEFGGVPTRTTVALGPAAAEEIDAITGPSGEVTTKLA